ncbi:hypothetical protein CXF64_04765 [Pseudoalteromonas sp. GutCa3]|nr:hypothetical protein CXF75_04045 [Pseudoalteromonas arctica]PKG71569.1 hypothetical protein CXF64_04765 [Pseudoalteromonas sp. GutCa3]
MPLQKIHALYQSAIILNQFQGLNLALTALKLSRYDCMNTKQCRGNYREHLSSETLASLST